MSEDRQCSLRWACDTTWPPVRPSLLTVRQASAMGQAGLQTWRRGPGRVRGDVQCERQMNWCVQMCVRAGGSYCWDFQPHMTFAHSTAAGAGIENAQHKGVNKYMNERLYDAEQVIITTLQLVLVFPFKSKMLILESWRFTAAGYKMLLSKLKYLFLLHDSSRVKNSVFRILMWN